MTESGPAHPPATAVPRRRGIVARSISLLRIAAGLAIVWLLLDWLGPRAVMTRIAACSPSAAFTSFVVALFGAWLAAMRLRLLARSQYLLLSRRAALTINLSAVFYGLFLPGGSVSSWFVKVLQLAPDASGTGAALWSLAGDRALTTAVGAGVGLIAGLLMSSPAHFLVNLLLCGILAAAVLLSVALFTPSLRVWWARAAALPGIRRLSIYLRRPESAGRPARVGFVSLALLLSLGIHILGILSWLILARALSMEVEPLAIAWVRSATLVVTLLPATVAGLGLREGAVVYLLIPFGISRVDALSLSMLVFAITVLGVGLVGGMLEAHRLLSYRRSE